MPDMRSEEQKQIDKIILNRVKAGIKLLQAKHGDGWVDKIDLRKLNLSSGSCCVLGQVYGDYCDGQERLGIDDTDAEKHGFYLNDEGRYDYDDLGEAWERELTKMIAP